MQYYSEKLKESESTPLSNIKSKLIRLIWYRMTLSDLASDLKSDFVSLVGEVHSGNSRVNSLSDLITDIDGTLKSTEESLSVFVLIEFEVAVLLVEVDVLVLTPPYIIVFLILISSLLLCSLYAFLLITQFAD